MFTPAPHPPAERFARLIDGLCRAVAARSGRGLAGPLIVLIWSRLRRIAARFALLAGRIRDGRLAAPAARRRHRAAPRPPAPRPRLPRGVAWLVRLVPEAAASGAQLQHLLADPEMAALIAAAAPQMRRILGPLCRMLKIRPPPGPLTPSPRPRAPAPPRPASSGLAPPAGAPPTGPPAPRYLPPAWPPPLPA